MKTVVVVNSEGMGHGDAVLGARILQTLLNKISALHELETLLFYNAGVKLLAEGSSMLPVLAVIEDNGVELIACGTCVDHFDLREKIRVGRVGSGDDVLAEMDRAEKVITL